MTLRLRWRTWFAVATLGLLAFLLLREANVIAFHACTTETSSSHEASWGPDSGFTKAYGWSVRVDFPEDEALDSPSIVHAAGNTNTAQIVARIDPLAIEGCTWLPLYKWGSCSYHARVLRDGVEWGTIDGSLEMKVKGLATRTYFHESLREAIRSQVSDTANSWMK
jgi:hypothetical protein